MLPDDDSKTTLSKWPFILGDALLVATALAIAVLGDWQLTNLQVASCVMAVALGAALYVLPFIVEFRVRVAEEAQGREADMRILERQLLAAQQEIDRLDARFRPIEESAEQASGSGTQLVEMVDGKLDSMSRQYEDLAAAIEGLKSKCAELDSRGEEKPVPVDTEQIAELEKKIAAVEVQLGEAKISEELDSRIAALEARALVEQVPAEPPLPSGEAPDSDPEPIAEAPPKKPQRESQPVLERPKREPRVRHRPDEPRLLERAISEKEESSSSAVTRIIGSKGKTAPKPAADSAEKEPSNESLEENAVLDEPETKADIPLDQVEPEAEKAIDEAPAPDSEKTEQKTAEVSPEPTTEMLFDEDPAPKPIKKKRVKKDDAVITASVFIGIGNKPFLRGSGAGLSWEKGKSMEFQEIGKWRWVAPAEMESPVEVQVFRNDEDGDQSGKYTLEPGQKLEVSPVF